MGYSGRAKRITAIIIASVVAVSSLALFIPGEGEEISPSFSGAKYAVATSLQPGWNIWSPGLYIENLTARDLTIIEPRIVVVTRIDEANETLHSYVRGISTAYDFPINFYDAYYIALEGEEMVYLNIPFAGRKVLSYEYQLEKGWNFVGILVQDYNMWIHDWVKDRVHGDVWVVAIRAYLSNTLIREDFRTYPNGSISIYDAPMLQAYVTKDEINHPSETFVLWSGIGFYLWVSGDATLVW